VQVLKSVKDTCEYGACTEMQVVEDALPPTISKEVAEKILFVGKAVRVLRHTATADADRAGEQSPRSTCIWMHGALCRPHGCTFWPRNACIGITCDSSFERGWVRRQGYPCFKLVRPAGDSPPAKLENRAWTTALRKLAAAPTFQRLDFERVLTAMHAQVRG
jgi:hypothetical protein